MNRRECLDLPLRTRNDVPRKYAKTYIDADALRHAIELKGYPLCIFSANLGFHHSYVNKILARGWTNYFTLDRIALALGRMPYEFERSPEYVH